MLKKLSVTLVVCVVGLAAAFVLGPRENVDETITFDPSVMGSDIDAYLAEREKSVPNLKPGAQKQIVWADTLTKAKQPVAVVYIHGFSASLEEVRPLPDLIAKQLDGNLYFTRLKGHGRDGPAMAEPSVNDWYNDVAEAISIGRAIGDKVVLVSTSTGGTLVSWALSKPELSRDVVASVMVSPNYAVQAAGADILTMPWARQLLPLLFGDTRSFEPRNAGQAKWWTHQYPNVALLPMQASVSHANALPFEDMTVPSLFIFHPEDGVVKSSVTKDIAMRWGANTGTPAQIHEIDSSDDTFHHVIAGDILSPDNTIPLAQKAVSWIKAL